MDSSKASDKISKISNTIGVIQVGIAKIQGTVSSIQEDTTEIKASLKNHDERIRELELEQATLRRGQEALTSDMKIRTGIIGAIATAAGAAAGFLSNLMGK